MLRGEVMRSKTGRVGSRKRGVVSASETLMVGCTRYIITIFGLLQGVG
jgi:hypothetical protein